MLLTGRGQCFVDRLDAPRAAVFRAATDAVITGDPRAIPRGALGSLGLTGLIEAGPSMEPILRLDLGHVARWERVIYIREPDRRLPETGPRVRRLRGTDMQELFTFDEPWIWNHVGGPSALVASGLAFGSFLEGRLASIALPFTWSRRYEDLAVATRRNLRGLGLATEAVAALVGDVSDRGRIPTWSTGVENLPSRRVAMALEFAEIRRQRLYLVGSTSPRTARRAWSAAH